MALPYQRTGDLQKAVQQIIANLFASTGAAAIGTSDGTVQSDITALQRFDINPISVGATIGPFSTVETPITNGMQIAANSFANSQRFRITVAGYCTSSAANGNSFRIRVGPNNSSADAQIMILPATAATSGTSIPWKLLVDIQIFGSGASTTISADGVIMNAQTSGIIQQYFAAGSNGSQSATINNNVGVYINATYQSAAATTSVLIANSCIEMLR